MILIFSEEELRRYDFLDLKRLCLVLFGNVLYFSLCESHISESLTAVKMLLIHTLKHQHEATWREASTGDYVQEPVTLSKKLVLVTGTSQRFAFSFDDG